RFAHVSDTHIGNPTGAADLQATIGDINRQPDLAFVIVSGDITEFGSDEELLQARSLLQQINKPWYVVPGNHDTKWSESGATSFAKLFGSETFHFEHKGVRFIGTSSGPDMRMGPGQVPRHHLLWLDSVLAAVPPEQPLIFVNHYPMNATLNNWYEVLERLKKYNVKAILCGHGHNNRLMDVEGVPGIMGRSNLRAKDPAGGYNIVTVTDQSIVYSERSPGRATLPPWCVVPVKEETRPQWTPAPERPDYRMNGQYPGVRVQWSLQESSDLAGGAGVYQELLVYATTAGNVHAVTAKEGRPVWSVKVPGNVMATPLVAGGRVVIPDTEGNIVCLNAGNGQLLWKYATGKPIVSSPAAYGESVIVAGSDGHCRALSLRSGTLLWQFSGIRNFVETRPLVEDGIVYFGSWGNEVYALQAASGELAWKWHSGHTNRMYSAAACWPVVSGNRLFVVAPDRHMTVLDKKTGAIIWRNYDSLHFVRESMGISEDKRQVYVKTMQGSIQAIDAAAPGREVNWVADENLGFDVCPTPLNERAGVVFVPSQSGVVYALQQGTGRLLWKYKVSNCLITAVQPLTENTVLVSAMDGKMACLSF
ncbi:MAG TPA: PQQ-binding-like beta-propeller repeat protein, partial [Chitinophagaceae bacterium]|nr:PQQ-binding-like beta-propeller repeat protein [Chitinophagaceae bacterium]